MAQPFRQGSRYVSKLFNGVDIRLFEDRMEISSSVSWHALSSAILPGGFSFANRIINWKVPLDYNGVDPVLDMMNQFALWGSEPASTVGLITAAKLTHASITESEGDRFNLLCCTTVGTRNAARAGIRRDTFSAYSPGTINTVLLIDGQMTESAMVNAIITATEAKAAAMQHLGIIEHASGQIATGTTTDAVVIGVSQRVDWNAVHAYAGAATTIGCNIGESVYRTVVEATRTQHEE
ncbi:adenosylcobinamide amidohydrolase [Paenibacillus endophyticus]|uniref:Adenosylcobinamide amidohydrolase n=1 Tax=Paenibacillus endophyticus TaxID=1294268 RepID=A0A7W5C6K2_9BACL|nr:adenosylcobinamide amidohydrolase [Paenibacillus endophyticus]MBB3151993.1 adenosylcobinamide amidohydrolase [Paenibacillus endophyticus]